MISFLRLIQGRNKKPRFAEAALSYKLDCEAVRLFKKLLNKKGTWGGGGREAAGKRSAKARESMINVRVEPSRVQDADGVDLLNAICILIESVYT